MDKVEPQIVIETSIGQAAKKQSLSPNSILYLSATDTQTGVEKLMYSINGGEQHLYRKPLAQFKPGKTLTLHVWAWDRVGNQSEKQVIYQIEPKR